MILEPPYTPLDALVNQVQAVGYSVLAPQDLYQLCQHQEQDWLDLSKYWDHLMPDTYLKDGGHYRQRRHSSLVIKSSGLEVVPHRAHWQPLSYNALHGGITRWFEPCEVRFIESPVIQDFLKQLGHYFSLLPQQANHKNQPWFVELHQFRIDTSDGIGRPTPEGAHRDGVDFVAVLMMKRQWIKGGETRVFESNGPQGCRFTLSQPMSLLVLDDERVIHETTPIQPIDLNHSQHAYRDTLVVTFRREGFQDSPSKLSPL